MAVVKKSTNNKCWQGYGAKGKLVYCWSACKLENSMEVSQKAKIGVPYDPIISLLGIHPEVEKQNWKTVLQKDTCIPVFIVTVFITVKIWKHPSTDEWIKKMWYIFIQWNITQP